MSLAKFIAVFAFCAFASSSTLQAADVVVSGQGKDRNPTVLFKGVSGNPQMSAQVGRDLAMCGWFDVVNGGSADFVVSGSSSGNAVNLTFANSAGVPLQNFSATGNGVDMASHKAVDAILNYNFKIDGICRTKIVFSAQTAAGQKEIYMCDFDGQNFKPVSNDGMIAVEPVWSPKGDSVIYCVLAKGGAFLIEKNLASNRSRRLAQFPGFNGGGRISPNGSTVALVLSLGGQLDLYTRGVEGGDLRRLTSNKAVEASPCWNPAGSQICFVSDNGIVGRPNLYVIGANGGDFRKLPGIGSENVTPSWSKDNRIVYSAKLGNYTLAVMDLSGKSTHLTGNVFEKSKLGGNWKSPSWAPDNRHVVCERNGELWVVDTWLGKARMLVNGRSKVAGPDWSEILY
jgi:TolB protein